MKLNKDQIVYYTSVSKVHKAKVHQEFNGEWTEPTFAVLVYCFDYKHTVYIKPDHIYFSRAHANKRIKLDKAIKNLRSSDIAEKITNEIL